MTPLVSIVTPSYNQGQFIRETIESVLNQDYPQIEYIVIDGGSTDNTLEILKTYSDRIRWLSAPDLGQADAVNKGFKMARGDILGWLNSDDTYTPGAIGAVVECFTRYPELVMIYGDACYIDQNGKIIDKYVSERFGLKRLAESCFICQPAAFIRSEVFERIGELDTNLHLCMDYDYWIRIGRHYPAAMIKYLEGVYLANSRIHSETKTVKMQESHYQECMETTKRHFGFIPDHWILAHMNVIGVKEQMKKYDGRGLPAKALRRLFYVTKKYGWRWGWLSFVVSCREGIKYLRRNLKGMGCISLR
jgi:glycosyltransferase involved in cell wall biosynthesis